MPVQQAPMMNQAIAPDLYAQQLQLQRQQQMADLLRQQSVTPIETGQMVTGAGPSRAIPVTGIQALAKILQAGISRYKQGDIDTQNSDLAKQYQGRMADMLRQMMPGSQVGTPPVNQSTSGGAPSIDGSMTQQESIPQRAQAAPFVPQDPSTITLNDTPQASTPVPQQAPQAPSQQMPVQGQRPDINRAAMAAMLMGDHDLAGKLIQQSWSAYGPTDATKMANAAGVDPRMANAGALAKSNYIAPLNARPGSIIRDPLNPNRVVAFNPHIPEGGMPQFDANGNVTSISNLPGAAGVTQGMAQAQAAGKNAVEPMTGVDASGQPIFTNKLAAAIGGQAPQQTGGAIPQMGMPQTSMPLPTAGNQQSFQIPPQVQAARDTDRLAVLQAELQKPTNSPSDNAAIQNEIARVQGQQAPQAPTNGAIRPSAAPGFNESQVALANAGADRYNKVIALASDSPTRVNVYDNILKLSGSGVQTGPGQDWMNRIKGLVANTPLLGSLAGKWKDDVTGAQELNKFMYQNAQRNWQAAGGTGTDAQLDAFSNASPNDKMFPQALQAMAQWGKASELGLQAKANANQNWKQQNGGNVANQDQFEQSWRNNFDPMLFQLKTMPPDQAAQMVNGLHRSNPDAYAGLMQKAQNIKAMGGF